MKTPTHISFRPLDIPNYRFSAVGRWHLEEAPMTKRNHDEPVALTAYFSYAIAKRWYQNWVLMEGNTIWMSLTPMELESQGYQARLARGHVLVAGLGMGVLSWNLLRNPKVTQVTVVEQSPDVIALLREGLSDLMEDDRVTIVNADAKTYVPDFVPDLLIADIWPNLGADEAVGDVIEMVRNTKVHRVAWWGQEFDIVNEMMKRKLGVDEGDKGLAFLEERVKAKLVGRSLPEYPRLAMQAVLLQYKANGGKL